MARVRRLTVATSEETRELVNAIAHSKFLRDFFLLFHDLTGLLIDCCDPMGTYWAPLFSRGDIPTFCRSMLSNPITRRWCQKCTISKIGETVAKQRPMILQCHAGVYGIYVPVVSGGNYLCVLSASPLLLSPVSVEQFKGMRRRLRRASVDPNKLQEQWLALPSGDERTLQIACDMLQLVAKYLAEKEPELRQLQKKVEHPAVQDAKVYIHQHLEEHLELKDISRAAFVSPHYLCRLFKKALGVSIQDYVWQQRVDLAKDLLASSETKITQIGLQVGFQSPNHFFRVFRRIVGVTPLAFRKTSLRDLHREPSPPGS